MNISHALALLLCLFALVSTPSEARRHHHPSNTASAAATKPARFDYYVLSLSWSPTYCLSHPQDRAQCGGAGFGLVLHGLWPQYSAGGYPHDCKTSQTLTNEAVTYGKTVFPSPKLVSHEWSKHGTCSGMDALAYFKLSDQARTSIKVPAMLDAPTTTQTASVADITQAFVGANPSLPANSLAIICSGRNLSEVRVCMSKDLAPLACGKGVKSQCKGSVRIRSVR